ncbi:hypothetical protein PEC18_36710 [Paucibacter sp. O1-1]|nr:hypothetical protein [Paucibacter sp. O1-1]MDA3831196.1 hypothetical protein [Paucibacter sp. O1-1]
MDTKNVVLAAARDVETGRVTQLLVGVADRKTRNWLSLPQLMPASVVAQCIQTWQRFETFHVCEAGPPLATLRTLGGADALVTGDPGGASFGLEDLPPCGCVGQRHTYRLGREVK